MKVCDPILGYFVRYFDFFFFYFLLVLHSISFTFSCRFTRLSTCRPLELYSPPTGMYKDHETHLYLSFKCHWISLRLYFYPVLRYTPVKRYSSLSSDRGFRSLTHRSQPFSGPMVVVRTKNASYSLYLYEGYQETQEV